MTQRTDVINVVCQGIDNANINQNPVEGDVELLSSHHEIDTYLVENY